MVARACVYGCRWSTAQAARSAAWCSRATMPWTPTEVALLAELAQVWGACAWRLRAAGDVDGRARGCCCAPAGQQRRALAALAVLCVVPVPLSVLAPAEVTAKDPFVVRAPLDGVIDRLYTQPNQRVTPGTPLFALDSTTLASRYAVANKNFDTAQEEYRQTAQLAVTEDNDRLDMALRKGKLDESQVELDYTARELARVRVTADRAGVAVFADPNDWTGKAVSVGEKVMLLADPGERRAHCVFAGGRQRRREAGRDAHAVSEELAALRLRRAYRVGGLSRGADAGRRARVSREGGLRGRRPKAGARRDGHGAHSRTLGAARVLRAAPAANGRAAVARLVGPRACADFTELIDTAKNRAHHRCPVFPNCARN